LNRPTDEERRHKIVEKLMNRLLKLVETPSPQRGWFLAVPYKSEIDPEQCGVEILSNLTQREDLVAAFEAISIQCLGAGIHPKFLADGMVNCIELVERAKDRQRSKIVVPGNFGGKPS
jgi:hypothetical protein